VLTLRKNSSIAWHGGQADRGATIVTPEQAHWMIVAARILMGGFYVVAGMHHFYLLGQLSKLIGARGVPAPRFVLIAGSLFQSIAGVLLMLGISQMSAAIGLIIFTLAASVMLLIFWDQDGDPRSHSITQWRCNFALIGGLLALAVTP
jgi:putative oxidoreductase